MEISKILTADVLDIIFEGRNKEYGAYDLRRTYGKRLTVSITVMFLLMGLLYGGMVLAGRTDTQVDNPVAIKDPTLIDIIPEPKQPELPPPPKQEATPVRTEKLVEVIKIVSDNEPVDPIPPVDVLENSKIGALKVTGDDDMGVVAPPSSDGVGQAVIVEPTRDDDNPDSVFLKVEIESSYPGGAAAWQRYLNRNFRYPPEAVDQGIEGRIMVQFVVDREGNVSDAVVLEGPKELHAEALRVIRKSGKWTPAIQNGKKVNSWKRQPITFQLPQE